jgi:hypothetical protein
MSLLEAQFNPPIRIPKESADQAHEIAKTHLKEATWNVMAPGVHRISKDRQDHIEVPPVGEGSHVTPEGSRPITAENPFLLTDEEADFLIVYSLFTPAPALPTSTKS